MNHKPNAVLSEPPTVLASLRALHETLRMHLGFMLLGVICLSVTLMALPLRIVLPRLLHKPAGRRLIAAVFTLYLRLLSLMGACRFDLSELDALKDGPAMIVAPNHPSLLDAVIILSRLPNAACIMKAELVNSLFFGAGSRLAGYIPNMPIRTMVQLAVADLREGKPLLLFPEGTRTSRFPIGPLQATVGLIAKHAGVPVQTVFIETNSGFLGKGWSLLWTPKMPVIYRVRLGKRFDPPRHTANFASELAHYFQSELAHAQLPDFPVSSGSA